MVTPAKSAPVGLVQVRETEALVAVACNWVTGPGGVRSTAVTVRMGDTAGDAVAVAQLPVDTATHRGPSGDTPPGTLHEWRTYPRTPL